MLVLKIYSVNFFKWDLP